MDTYVPPVLLVSFLPMSLFSGDMLIYALIGWSRRLAMVSADELIVFARIKLRNLVRVLIVFSNRVFLIDGIITMPIAIMGYMYFPDTPEKTKASFLKESEKRLALTRLPVKREDGHNINPWSLAKRVVTSPAL